MSSVKKSKDDTKQTRESAASEGIKCYKEGRYVDAVKEFTKYLESNPEDKERKVAYYNRGMANHFLGEHCESLKDAEMCLKIDPFWAKAYKCKGLALEGMGKAWEAMDTLLNGQKMTCDVDKNWDKILTPLIIRLNKETGFLEEDLEKSDRMNKEKYCVYCSKFEKDLKEKTAAKDFKCCERCKKVSYCCEVHKEEDTDTHKEVCGKLETVQKKSRQMRQIYLIWRNTQDIIFTIAQEIKGPLGQQLNNMRYPIGELKKEMDDLKTMGCGHLSPIHSFKGFPPTSEDQQKGLKSWDDWFSLPGFREVWMQMDMANNMFNMMFMWTSPGSYLGDLASDVKQLMTSALTDAMTVFYVMKEAELFGNGRKNMTIHVVGAEPREELQSIKGLLALLTSLLGLTPRIVLIGPLLTAPPPTVQQADLVITTFGGTYQDFLKSRNYKCPDLIAGFYPGLYDGTYSWSPVVSYAACNGIPFLVTCNDKEDYKKTKDWLAQAAFPKPNVILDCANPFASWEIQQISAGSNRISSRNMFSVLILGGQ